MLFIEFGCLWEMLLPKCRKKYKKTENAVLPSRCKESSPRGLHADMSALCHAGYARHRTVWSGRAHRWVDNRLWI